MPNSPNSSVKKPKKSILIDDKIKTVNGKIKDMKIKTLLALFNQSFCNSKFISRSIVFSLWLD